MYHTLPVGDAIKLHGGLGVSIEGNGDAMTIADAKDADGPFSHDYPSAADRQREAAYYAELDRANDAAEAQIKQHLSDVEASDEQNDYDED